MRSFILLASVLMIGGLSAQSGCFGENLIRNPGLEDNPGNFLPYPSGNCSSFYNAFDEVATNGDWVPGWSSLPTSSDNTPDLFDTQAVNDPPPSTICSQQGECGFSIPENIHGDTLNVRLPGTRRYMSLFTNSEWVMAELEPPYEFTMDSRFIFSCYLGISDCSNSEVDLLVSFTTENYQEEIFTFSVSTAVPNPSLNQWYLLEQSWCFSDFSPSDFNGDLSDISHVKISSIGADHWVILDDFELRLLDASPAQEQVEIPCQETTTQLTYACPDYYQAFSWVYQADPSAPVVSLDEFIGQTSIEVDQAGFYTLFGFSLCESDEFEPDELVVYEVIQLEEGNPPVLNFADNYCLDESIVFDPNASLGGAESFFISISSAEGLSYYFGQLGQSAFDIRDIDANLTRFSGPFLTPDKFACDQSYEVILYALSPCEEWLSASASFNLNCCICPELQIGPGSGDVCEGTLVFDVSHLSIDGGVFLSIVAPNGNWYTFIIPELGNQLAIADLPSYQVGGVPFEEEDTEGDYALVGVTLLGQETITSLGFERDCFGFGPPEGIVPNHPSGDKSSVAIAAVKVYPNPVQQSLVIDLPKLDVAKSEIFIFDHLGKLWHQAQTRDTRSQVDVSEWPAGIYYLHWTGNEQGQVTKIVVQH